MAIEKKSSQQRSGMTTMMTREQKKELLSLIKNVSPEEELEVKEKFYKKIGFMSPSIEDRWESDTKLYTN